MPRTNVTTVKHINITLMAGEGRQVAPDTPLRNYLRVRNGVNPSTLKFGYAASGSASDEYLMSPGEVVVFDTVVPINSINVYSAIGSVINVIEGVEVV